MIKIESYGKGLNILICSNYSYPSNWMSYSCWYSLNKVLPEANVAIAIARSTKVDSYLYGWTHRVGIKSLVHKNIGEEKGHPYLNKIYGLYVALKKGLISQPLIVLEADMMAIAPLSNQVIEVLNKVDFATSPCPFDLSFSENQVGPVWFFNNQPLKKIEQVINNLKTINYDKHLDLLSLSKIFSNVVVEELGDDVQSKNPITFAHYREKCGGFVKDNWMRGKILPPFDLGHALFSTEMSANERAAISMWSQINKLYQVMN